MKNFADKTLLKKGHFHHQDTKTQRIFKVLHKKTRILLHFGQ